MTTTMDGSRLTIAAERFPDMAHAYMPQPPASVVLAGGCFWCVEAVFRPLQGVTAVYSGYAGGSAATAHYDAVCTGTTDHAEVVQVMFDPNVISYNEILKIFFAIAHDPTQKDQQGNDRGRQYRSAIFFQNEQEQRAVDKYIHQLDQAAVFSKPIATTLEPLDPFYPAEDYHQDYAAHHPHQPYIQHVAKPKVEKLKKSYSDRLK